MATYEDDHNLPPSSTSTSTPTPTTSSSSSSTSPPLATTTTRRHRLNISDFFSPTTSTTTSRTSSTSPPPSAFATLAAAFSELAMTPVMEDLLASLRTEAENPTSAHRSKGVPEGWTDGLERVARSVLKKDDICAICNSAFLDDPYPLVVRLPCHEMHVFDLECIGVWLRLHSTCPLDRTDLLKKKELSVPPPVEDEDEEEWDDNYG